MIIMIMIIIIMIIILIYSNFVNQYFKNLDNNDRKSREDFCHGNY